MFDFVTKICLIGFSDTEYERMKLLSKDYTEVISLKEITENHLKETDFVIAKISLDSIKSLKEKIRAVGKNTDSLILCLKRKEIPEIAMEEFYDVWFEDFSEQELMFYFSRFMREILKEHQLFETKEVLEVIINSTDDLIWAKDIQGAHKLFNNKFMEALPAAEDGHRKTKEECYGRGHLFIWELSKEDYEEGEFICMESEHDVIKADATLTFEEILKVSTGELRNLVTRKSTVHDKHGEIVGTVGIARDVTRELEYKELLEKNAYTDTLTGLYNRRYMYEYMEKQSKMEFSLLYMDLDNFKYVNDTYGHHKGDEAISLTSQALTEILDDYVVGRIGGDEFIAIGTDVEKLEEDTKRVKEEIKKLYHSDECFSKLRISIGTSVYNPTTSDIDEAINSADSEMYKNKMERKRKKK